MDAYIVSVAVLVTGIVLAYVIKRFKLGDSVTFLALLLIPLLTYGVVSGKISEFTAPGGWGAKFEEVAARPVQPGQIAKLSVEQITELQTEGDVIAKGGATDLSSLMSRLQPGKPLALTLQLGRSGYYNTDAIAQYIRTMLSADPEMSVVVVDDAGRYVASAPGNAVVQQLPSADFAYNFIRAIESGDPAAVLALPGFSEQSIADTASNVEALQKMEAQDLNRLVALDPARKPEGFVMRDQIVSQLLIGLASAQP